MPRSNFRSLPQQRKTTRSSTRKAATAKLPPVAKAVHERVESFFKATKSSARAEKAVNGTVNHAPDAPKDTIVVNTNNSATPKAKSKKANQDAHKRNSVATVIPANPNIDRSAFLDYTNADDVTDSAQNGVSQEPNAEQAGPGFRVDIPRSNINHADFMEVAETLDAPHHLSARRADQVADGQDVVGTGVDQRQRGEAALDSLNSLIRSVFSAVGKAFGMEQGQEHIVTLLSEQEATFTAATQHKLHGALQKTIDLKTFDRVPIESLLQILKLSEGSLRQLGGMDLHIDESWDEAGVEAWTEQLSRVDSSLKSARTCLRILSGGRDDKQLYSESIILKCVNLFKSISEDVISPLVELRSTGLGSNVFKLLGKHKKLLSSTFISCQKLFALLADLVAKIELSETAINTLEYNASKLIFVENAHSDRESIVGIQKFDGIRAVAMDILCQIFLIKPEQRQGIIDDILTSLEKLPIGKQSSRQFKLSNGSSIQPVSALIMRLVQASSGHVDTSSQGRRATLLQTIDDEGDAEGEFEMQEPSRQHGHNFSSITSEDHASQQHAIAVQELDATSSSLAETAARNASYVINFIVKRAIGSTKSGDTPYRNLLDLFVDDFTTCLDSTDWPSAELLLRLLMLMMVQLVEAPKTAAPAKNMALELLGGMSAAISRLRSHVKRTAASFEGGDSDNMSRYLADLALRVLEQNCLAEQLVDWAGPYRATLEHTQARCAEDPHLASAISFMIVDWACRTHTVYNNFTEEDGNRDASMGKLAYRLRKMIQDRQWLSNEFTFKAVSPAQSKFAYSILLLRSPLCESFPKILNILLGSMASDQATVRSKSLKSVNQVLETDPSILDGDSSVIQLILECASDSSIQVRDSALGLLGSCISMRPVLEPTLTPKIIDRFHDAGVGVRKRAMKLARDIYLRNRNKSIRTAIANGLLRRIQDPDEGVRDLARQMIEEIWFVPFYMNDGTAAFQTAIREHVALVIQTVKTGTVTEILDKVFQTILRPNNKSLEGPFSVCSKLVGDMFGLLDNPDSEDGSVPSGKDALQVLTIFAKADPKLFNFEQIRLLKPQLASYNGPEELAAFRAVTVIYRRVLPELSTVNTNFLAEVRAQLLKGIGKISSRGALDDLIACAKSVCDLMGDIGPLANLVAGSLTTVQKLSRAPLDANRLPHLSAYAIIIGTVGKHCDLDSQIRIFREKIPTWQGDSVPRLIVDILSPFTSPQQPPDARKASLEAIGLVCQSWPRNYALAKVYTAFQQVFTDQIPALETMILRSFKEFLVTEEKRSEAAAEAPAKSNKKELTVMGGTNFDDVASATTQRFLKDITRIALSGQDENAFLAMEVLGSINRQGLTHPKETGVTLITLETSANRKIAELAFLEHRSLHEKHETVLEREYVKAVQAAYAYQRDVVQDSRGATTDPFQSKLHLMIEVLKISKMKNRQRFFEKLCGQVDFDLSKLNVSQTIPHQVDYARFIVENLAYFEYQTIGELQGAVNKMEKIVTTTGATVAQAVESELFNARMDAEDQHNGMAGALSVDEMGLPVPAPPPPIGVGVDPKRFRQLAAASIILQSLWEVRTYLRRLYGMGTSRHDSKAKALAKDLNKTPLKVQGVHGDKIWEELMSHANGLESDSNMGAACKAFVELMNVDKEFKVADEDDDLGMDDPNTPSEGDDDDDEGADRGRKRKGASTPGGRKKRQRSSSQNRKRGRPRKSAGESDDELLDENWV